MSTPKLQSFGPEIWLAGGSEADVAGFLFPTRMIVIRLTGGDLFVWAPVAPIEDDARAFGARAFGWLRI